MKLTKIIALVLTLVMMTSGAAFANEAVNADEAPITNGAIVENVTIVEVEGIKMMPLRLVAEGLGYSVVWNGDTYSIELIKGAHYITMSIGEDSYAFSRRAPQSLGAAPYMYQDSYTYVPVSFIPEIIGGYYTVNEDGSYKFVIPTSVTASTINTDNIVVTDNITGEEIIVYIDENTEIVNGKLADIKEGMMLGVEYGPAMTMSLPAQTTAVKIIIENALEEITEEEVETNSVTVEFSGVITEVEGEKIVLGNPITDADSIALIITDETVIRRGLDKRIYKLDDLTVGTKIEGTMGGASTMSIPPQSVALTINIVE